MRDAEDDPLSSAGREQEAGGDERTPERDDARRLQDRIHETLMDSFPASDPPSWALGNSRGDFDGHEDIDK